LPKVYAKLFVLEFRDLAIFRDPIGRAKRTHCLSTI
jgi:hypothetical protein